MSGLLMLAALPLLALGTGESDPDSSPSAPKTLRYRVESKAQQVIDLSALGQGKQENTSSQTAVFSVTLSDSAGGKVMHVVIDSMAVTSPQPGVAEAAAKAKGAWLHGFVDSWGRGRVSATSADTSDLVSQLKTTMTRFFPVVKPGGKAGDTWVDTANVDVKTASQALKSTRISTYTLGGSAQWGGGAATKLDATSVSSGAGTIENPMAGTMELEVTGTGTEAFYLAADGTYLGGESTQNSDSKVRSAMLPEPIPVKGTTTTTITLLK